MFHQWQKIKVFFGGKPRCAHHQVHVLCQERVHAAVLPRDRCPEYEGERVVSVPRDGGEEGDADGGEEAQGGG